VLQDVTTAAGQVDVLSMTPDQTQLRFTPGTEKTFNLTIARRVGDQARAIAIRGAGGGPAADVELTTSPQLSFANLSNPGAARNVEVEAFAIDRNNKLLNKQLAAVNLTSKSELKVEVQNWEALDANVQTLKSQ
jgi:hypothetical protein